MKTTDDQLRLITASEIKSFSAELKTISWCYWLNRPYSVFMATIFWESTRAKVYSRTGFQGLEPNCHLYQFPDLYYKQQFHKKGLKYFDHYFKIHKMSNLSVSFLAQHKHHIKQLKKLIKNKTYKPAQKLKEMSELIQDYGPYLWMITQLEEHFNQIIAQEVPKYVKGDYSKFVGDIGLPDKKNSYVLMLDDLKKGISLKKIKEQYGWIKSRDGFTDFYTEEELKEIRDGMQVVKKQKIKIPKELMWLSEELKELNYFRTLRTDMFYEFFGVARPLMQDVAKFIGVSFKELADYDVYSIINGQPKKYNKNFSYGLINNRYYITNEQIINFHKNYNQEIKGRVAYKGLVRGCVKIVTHSDQLNKVKTGDILVSQMTFPSFISAMQKAAAFVTDEGSITCHAAIVAREMKKPCIVGTKNATKILKDGDIIEVDAENGIVTKLK